MFSPLAGGSFAKSLLRPDATVFTPTAVALSQTQEIATKVALACLDFEDECLNQALIPAHGTHTCESMSTPLSANSKIKICDPLSKELSQRLPLRLAKRSNPPHIPKTPANHPLTIEELSAAHKKVSCILPTAQSYFQVMLEEGRFTSEEIHNTLQALDKTAAVTGVCQILVDRIPCLETFDFTESIDLCQSLVHRLQCDQESARCADVRSSISAQLNIICKVIGHLRREHMTEHPKDLYSLISSLANEIISPIQLDLIEQHADFCHF